MMPKTFSIKGGGLGEIQKIFVPAHDVTGSGGDRQIDVWFILGIPLICEDVRDFRNDYRSFFERREEAIDKLVRQYRELLPHPWTGHYIALRPGFPWTNTLQSPPVQRGGDTRPRRSRVERRLGETPCSRIQRESS
jgi:hypothetical protein